MQFRMVMINKIYSIHFFPDLRVQCFQKMPSLSCAPVISTTSGAQHTGERPALALMSNRMMHEADQ